MGNRIFGCDDCLAACPWNDRAKAGRELRLAARAEDAAFPNLLDWLALLAQEAVFKAKFAGTPLLRPKREGLRRNVCIALGNVGGEDAIAPLMEVLQTDSSSVVRATAAWALGEIAQRTANNAVWETLRKLGECETDVLVGEEIRDALLSENPSH
jgi:epoxyqueuosine reductase